MCEKKFKLLFLSFSPSFSLFFLSFFLSQLERLVSNLVISPHMDFGSLRDKLYDA